MTETRFNSRRVLVGCIFLMAALAALAACGEVITPEPTATVTPASTSPSAPTPTLRPTATSPLVPPPDTATPTITPTPVTHVVQDGETLLGIALDYGVSPEALQAANGIDDPRLLQVGQTLIIPPAQAEETGTDSGLLLPTPTPLPFGWTGVAFYQTPVGSLQCLGEVVNTTDSALTNIQVRVILLDAAGEQLTTADAFVAADLIPPGQRSPFGILFTSPPEGWANSQVSVIRGDTATSLAESYVPISVSQLQGEPAGSQFQVSGIVQNGSDAQAADSVAVIATTYDAEGLVTGFRQEKVPIEDALGPGETKTFSMLFSFHGDVPADFNVTALGRITTE